MLVLADRNFLSHTLARDVLGTGAYILWRASASFRLTPIAVLADGSYLARLHPRRKAGGRSRYGSSSTPSEASQPPVTAAFPSRT